MDKNVVSQAWLFSGAYQGLKRKTAFPECWTSIKIKINMTCMSKECEIITKIEQEQWLQLEMLFLLG